MDPEGCSLGFVDRLRYMSIDAESCLGVSNEIDGKSDGKNGTRQEKH
jgi:hypothetical protein